jgi:hypothetical protein
MSLSANTPVYERFIIDSSASVRQPTILEHETNGKSGSTCRAIEKMPETDLWVRTQQFGFKLVP